MPAPFAAAHRHQAPAGQCSCISSACLLYSLCRSMVALPQVKVWLAPSTRSRIHWLTWIGPNRKARCMEPKHRVVSGDLLGRSAATHEPRRAR